MDDRDAANDQEMGDVAQIFDPELRQRIQRFIQVYKDQADPSSLDGISSEEALQRYEQVISIVPKKDLESYYKPAAEETFKKLPSSQRIRLGRMLAAQAPNFSVYDEVLREARGLADPAFNVQNEGGGLIQAFAQRGGESMPIGDWLYDPLTKATLGGIAAMTADMSLKGKL